MPEIFQYPFMQRALFAGAVLGFTLSYLGIFIVLKRMAFFSDGVAHASLAGVAIGILAGFAPLLSAVVFSVIFSLLIYFLEKKTKLPADAIIGILFASGMALGILLMSLKPGYQPELISYLFGNILAIKMNELVLISALAFVVSAFIILNWKKLILIAFDQELAHVSGIKIGFYQVLTYVLMAVAVVSGIKVLGIILVSALLVIPVSIAKLLTSSFKSLSVLTLIVSETIIIGGIVASYYLNLPTGALIVLIGALFFVAALAFGGLRKAQ